MASTLSSSDNLNSVWAIYMIYDHSPIAKLALIISLGIVTPYLLFQQDCIEVLLQLGQGGAVVNVCLLCSVLCTGYKCTASHAWCWYYLCTK